MSRFLLIAAAAVPMAFGQASPKGVTLANVPLAFEPNVGQTDGSVRFFARSQGMNVFFTDHEVVMGLHQRSTDPNASSPEAVVRMKLVGGRTPTATRGLDPQSGVSNYFIGNNPKDWHAGVARYGRVSLTGVYDGVDLISYGNQRNLEYDFVVAPEVDPSRVQLAFDGVASITVNAVGDLVLRTPVGDVVQKRPQAYQNTANGRVDVEAKYVLSPDRKVSFELASYDRRKPLVIDPVLSYSTYLAGTGYDEAWGVAVDTAGAAYITGWTDSTNFANATSGRIGSDDAFVTKLATDGKSVVYTTYFGGLSNDHGYAIAVDQNGYAYITGDTEEGPMYWPQIGIQVNPGGGTWDAFVVKLSATGIPLYSTLIGGIGNETGWGIAVDASGSAYVAGETSGNLQPTAGAFKATYGGGPKDGFVVKIGPRGGLAVYETYLGGIYEDVARGIAVDAAGNAYVAGWTFSSDFPSKPNYPGYQSCLASESVADAFVTKLSPTGQSAVYSTCLGGNESDKGYAIAVDSAGAAYVTGSTQSPAFPPMGGFQSTLNGPNGSTSNSDAFVTKLTPDGTALVYSSFLGGSGTEIGTGIAIDSSGAAYVTGWTDSGDLAVAFAPQSSNGGGTAGGQDAFVARITPSGNTLGYLTYLGGAELDNARAIAVDAVGAAFVVGVTYSNSATASAAFPTTAGAFQASPPSPNNHNDSNGFVTKLTGSLTPNGAAIYSPLVGFVIRAQLKSPVTIGFQWTPAYDAASYELDVGVACGGKEFSPMPNANVGRSTSATVTIPAGVTGICARLITFFDTLSVPYDYKYGITTLLH